MNTSFTLALLSVGLSLPFSSFADGRPPADAKPVSKLLADLEKVGFAPIVDVSFDSGKWEIEAYKGNEQRELLIDSVTGAIVGDRADEPDPKPPANAKPLSAVILTIEQAGNATILDITFDDGRWEVDILRDGQTRELHIDPESGAVVDDRADN